MSTADLFRLENDLGKRLIRKVNTDLKQGVKILGDFSNKADIIRVWTSFQDSIFAVVASSSARFQQASGSYMEIQSLNLPTNLRLAVFSHNYHASGGKIEIHVKKILADTVERELSAQDQKLIDLFLTLYLASRVNKQITQNEFARYHYSEDQYQWL